MRSLYFQFRRLLCGIIKTHRWHACWRGCGNQHCYYCNVVPCQANLISEFGEYED